MAPCLQLQGHFSGHRPTVGVPPHQVGALGLRGEDVQGVDAGEAKEGGREGEDVRGKRKGLDPWPNGPTGFDPDQVTSENLGFCLLWNY